MPKRNWKTFRPTSLQDAIEGCIEFARERQNLSVDRIADLMQLPSKWTLYKWMEAASLPVRAIPAFEHACGCSYVTAYLAASAHKLLLDLPHGRIPKPGDIALLQAACADAVQALIGFAAGERSADDTQSHLTRALERLAFEREQVARALQPELELP